MLRPCRGGLSSCCCCRCVRVVGRRLATAVCLVPAFFRLLVRVAKSRLVVSLLLSLFAMLILSRFTSNTLFHYAKFLDSYTLRLGDDKSTDLTMRMNEQRVKIATDYLVSYNKSQLKPHLNKLIEPGPGKDVVIAIVTIDRLQMLGNPTRPSYFTQTVAKVFRELERYYDDSGGDLARKLRLELVFCAVDILPFINSELTFVQSVTSITTLNRFNYEHPAPPSYMQLVNRYEREKQDYVFCMNSSFHMKAHQGKNPSYVLVVEDDAPPINNYFSILEDLIRNKLDRNSYGHHADRHDGGRDHQAASESTTAGNRGNLLYVKLFHPNNLLEFHSTAVERIPQLIALAVLLSFVAWSAYALFCARKSLQASSLIGLSWATSFSWKSFSQLFVYFLVVVLVAGRPNTVFHYQNWLAKFFGLTTLVPAPSCCTPAILYPDVALPNVVDFIDKSTCYEKYAKDAALDDLRHHERQQARKASRHPRLAWLVQPNLHSHVGQFSVVRRQVNANYRQFIGIEY